jgi:hypothetical protein
VLARGTSGLPVLSLALLLMLGPLLPRLE